LTEHVAALQWVAVEAAELAAAAAARRQSPPCDGWPRRRHLRREI